MNIGDGSAIDRPIGVISAVVSSDDRDGQILLGVRRGSSVAARHPGVVSTPTVRVPADLFQPLVADYLIPKDVEGIYPVSGEPLRIGRSGHVASAHAFLLESLLMRKLGLADGIASGEFTAVSHPRYLALAEVKDPLGTQESEWTAMLTYEVRIIAGVDAIPIETSSYKRLLWVDSIRLPVALERGDAMILDDTLNVFEVCAQGLCLRVAAELLGQV
jgi:hypothetical protein